MHGSFCAIFSSPKAWWEIMARPTCLCRVLRAWWAWVALHLISWGCPSCLPSTTFYQAWPGTLVCPIRVWWSQEWMEALVPETRMACRWLDMDPDSKLHPHIQVKVNQAINSQPHLFLLLRLQNPSVSCIQRRIWSTLRASVLNPPQLANGTRALRHREKTAGLVGNRRVISLLTGWKAKALTPRWPMLYGDSETWWWKTRSTSDRRTTFKPLPFTLNSQDSNLCKTFLQPNLSHHDSRCDQVLMYCHKSASAIIISISCVCVNACVKRKINIFPPLLIYIYGALERSHTFLIHN